MHVGRRFDALGRPSPVVYGEWTTRSLVLTCHRRIRASCVDHRSRYRVWRFTTSFSEARTVTSGVVWICGGASDDDIVTRQSP